MAIVDHGSPVPELDLLIRTGGERRLSDFLLWEAAYAELLFLERLWPDFGEADLAAAIRDYRRARAPLRRAHRRGGGMSPMTDRTRQGLTIGAAALAVSVAGDILERTVPERLDLALGVGALVLAICYVLAREPELDAPHPGFGLAAGVLVVALVWRDSEVLFALNLLAIGAVGVLALPQVRALGPGRPG